MRPSIVFVHGAWVTPLCWESFRLFFEARGYSSIAPAWPGKEDTVDAQRQSPSPILAGLGIGEIVDHYEKIVRGLSEPPILIGHSYGGLFVQLLLDRKLGSAGVAIDSAPPRGLFAFYPSTVRSLGKVLLTWQGWRKIVRTTFPEFRYAFVNNMPPEQQRAVYEKQVVPETGRIFFQSALAPLSAKSPARLNFRKPGRTPLLLVAGGSDHIVPAAINRANYRRARQSPSLTTFKEFPARAHWIIAQDGWDEVAGFIADWLDRLPGSSRSAEAWTAAEKNHRSDQSK
jgi:pimeloyl-ACP methyl ester carboxylesterase